MCNRNLLAVLCVCWTLAGCGSDASSPPPREAPAPHGSVPVPLLTSTQDCETSEESGVGVCDWLLSTDAVVWGTLRRVSLASDLLIHDTYDEWRWTTTCSGAVRPALLLEVEVDRVFHGSVPDVIHVRAGSRQAGRLRPMPFTGPDGTVEWMEIGLENGTPLVAGRSVGLALHRIAELDVWSLKGEPMFGVMDSGHLVFARPTRSCGVPPVPVIPGASTLDDLQRMLEPCGAVPTEQASMRRRMVDVEWGPAGNHSPEAYAAAVCLEVPETPPPGTCSSDAECGAGEHCVSGTCG